MRRIAIIAIALALGIACNRSETASAPASSVRGTPAVLQSNGMTISSSAFATNAAIPAKYTCDGAGISPPLAFGGIPASAKALALVVSDPDAPSGTFRHWIVWNIPTNVTAVQEGQPPAGGTESDNDFGQKGWGGPCPPTGQHHYLFDLYALDSEVGAADEIRKHAIAQARLVGVYARK